MPTTEPGVVLDSYLRGLRAARSVGVAETSFYGPLQHMLNEVGSSCQPSVTTIMHPRSSGAGLPDGGIFLSQQLGRSGGESVAFEEQPPTHGVIEAKPIAENLDRLAGTSQVRRYLERYGKVLITNFREFRLLELDRQGVRAEVSRLQLAADEESFNALLNAKQISSQDARRIVDGLAQMLAVDAPIFRPKDLAYHLASYARQALSRLEKGNLSSLDSLRDAFDETLGISFQGAREERFFRSTLVQTLFYGTFSAWVLWSSGPEAAKGETFDWRRSWFTKVPVVGKLFAHIVQASGLQPVEEVLDWAGGALNRVERDAFFKEFDAEAAVQYFYEPFLAEFDPELRRQLGVWYTPPEVVNYMVRNVDNVLREQFDLPDGIADENVYILDPCTGTGSFLIETLRLIRERRTELNSDDLVGDDVRRAVKSRIFGFEILPAPFVIAHLQIGLFLASLGSPLDADENERANVYLTNALIGWGDEAESAPSMFPALANERDAARGVKRDTPILVVLGNPPYNAFAGVSPAEEGGLVELYKEGLAEWGFGTRNSIDDLYIRFLRVAERRITEMTGRGVVSFISNFGYLSDPTLVVVRQRLLKEFDHIWVDNLNGDSRETGKRTPEGAPDPSIFGSPGIQTGTAILTLARLPIADDTLAESQPEQAEGGRPPVIFGEVNYRDFWGSRKRADLVASLSDDSASRYTKVAAVADSAYSFRPVSLNPEYPRWPTVADLAEKPPMPGLLEKRRGALVDSDRAALEARIRSYLDSGVGLADLGQDLRGLTTPAARFDPLKTRERLIENGGFISENIRRFQAKPLDRQWAYVETRTSLWNEARPDLVAAATAKNRFLLVRRRTPRSADGSAFLLTDCPGDEHAMHKDAYYLPFKLQGQRLLSTDEQPALLELSELTSDRQSSSRANLSSRARAWLAALGAANPDLDDLIGGSPFLHALAIGYSPRYLADNKDAGRFTYHRLPLPGSLDLLRVGAGLGARIGALLDTDSEVDGITSRPGDERAFWFTLASLTGSRAGSSSSLRLENWAILQEGRVMPVAGRVTERQPSDEERVGRRIMGENIDSVLGSTVIDIHLNDECRWQGVPLNAFRYSIGGYPTLRKWLSYRDSRALGRALTQTEARQFSSIVRRTTALLLMGPELDAYYSDCLAFTYDWRAGYGNDRR